MPKVSIVMPVYNVENYLAHCLNSILAQTYSDFELICVNDGAKDSSREILQAYADKDARIKIVDKENGGAYSARNVGLTHITGEYVQFIDADDAIEPQCVEIAVSLLDQGNVDMVYFETVSPRLRDNKIEGKLYDLSQMKVSYHKDAMKDTFGGKLPTECMSWFKICRAELIEGLSFIKGITFEDTCFAWEILTQRPRAAFVRLPLYHYTLNGASLSNTVGKLRDFEELNDVLTQTHEVFIRKGLKREARQFSRLYVPPLVGLQFQLLAGAKGREDEAELREYFRKEVQGFMDRGMLSWRSYLPICLFSVLPDWERFKPRARLTRLGIKAYRRSLRLARGDKDA